MEGTVSITREVKAKKDWRTKLALVAVLALLSAGAVFLLDLAGALHPLELKAYDGLFLLRFKLAPSARTEDSPVVLVEIDDKTLNEKNYRIPRVLWHNYFAEVIQGLADGGARVIGLDFLLPQEVFDDLVPDYSRTWLRALVYAKNKGVRVVTGMVRTTGRQVTPADRYLQIIGAEQFGYFNFTTDSDDFCRRQRLFFPSAEDPQKGVYHVSFLLAKAFRPALTLPAEVIYVDYDLTRTNIVRYSFADLHQKILNQDTAFLSKSCRNKIVLIGETDSLSQDRHPTPLFYLTSGAFKRTPGVAILGHTVDTILEGRPSRDIGLLPRGLIYLVLTLIVSTYTLLGSRRLVLAFWPALTLVWMVTAAVLFLNRLIPPAVAGVVAVFLGQAAAFSYRYWKLEREKEEVEGESFESSRMLGLTLQSQGMLDLAFEKFLRLPLDKSMKETLYNLGLDFERKRLFNKAKEVYEHIKRHDAQYKDVAAKIKKMSAAGGTLILGAAAATGVGWAEDGSLVIDEEARPVLGRYEVIKVLGQGAMGTVYLGKDPKIGRMTAIKTVRFSDEYETEEAERIKKQFFREAETAGALSHPNIVTIYDAGEEHDLSYIAMELLEGHDLKANTKPDMLLPVRTVIEIMAHVADALGYAHQKGVVHRDIKPANIMLLDSGVVKVADFGVARVMASSMTRTGVIKGTPYYMSPEQIMGQKVDGRSDIFSLGVVFYELLTGQLPFHADELEALIFKITSEDPVPASKVNPKVPKVVDQIIGKALVKDRNHRYQRAEKMGEHLLLVGQKMDEAREKMKGKGKG
ncbi:MAG: protein kinase [Thermodesulfobacteriota bacterium]